MRLIDADALLIKQGNIARVFAKSDAQKTLMGRVMFNTENAPTVDAEPVRHGRWIFKERKGIKEAWYQCSECNAYDLREKDATSHYCWACGAKMDGERREDDAI